MWARMTILSNLSALTNSWRECGPCFAGPKKPGRAQAVLEIGDVRIDFVKQQVWRGKRPLHLTAKEFAMLRLLAEAAGEPITRERFLDVVWGYTSFPTTRTVDNHVASLRAKLGHLGQAIETVHGVGYRLLLAAGEKEGK